MKKLVALLSVLVAFLAGALGMREYKAHTEPDKTEKIAVLNMDTVVLTANVYRNVLTIQQEYQKNLQAELTATQKKLQAEEKVLSDENNTLLKEKSEMSEPVFARRMDTLQKKVVDFQQKVYAFQKEYTQKVETLKKASNQVMQEVQKKTIPVLARLTEEKGIQVLLGQNSTLFYMNSVDVTEEFVARLNEEKLVVPFPNPFAYEEEVKEAKQVEKALEETELAEAEEETPAVTEDVAVEQEVEEIIAEPVAEAVETTEETSVQEEPVETTEESMAEPVVEQSAQM